MNSASALDKASLCNEGLNQPSSQAVPGSASPIRIEYNKHSPQIILLDGRGDGLQKMARVHVQQVRSDSERCRARGMRHAHEKEVEMVVMREHGWASGIGGQ